MNAGLHLVIGALAPPARLHLRNILRGVEWSKGPGADQCPVCFGVRPDFDDYDGPMRGHGLTCPIDKALGILGGPGPNHSAIEGAT